VEIDDAIIVDDDESEITEQGLACHCEAVTCTGRVTSGR
jgi:hypothetical protein